MKKQIIILHIVFIMGLLLPAYSLFGQDLSNLDKKDPLKVNGSVSANQVYFNQSGKQDYGRDPYSYYLMGRLNIAVYGWNIPLSYRYSNQDHNFQQPFNQFSLSPKYKWIKAHIGYSSMSFSSYTLSGHQFYGAGIELQASDNFEVSMMYGRLKKATQPDSLNMDLEPSFRRRAYGMQATLRKWNGRHTVTIFRSKDEQASLDSIPVKREILPEENLVMSFKTSQTIFRDFSFNFEYAGTAITSDIRSKINTRDIPRFFNNTMGLFTPRQSSSFHNALNASMNYSFESSSIALEYERVEPEYRTHGAYYFRNDLENLTINGQTTFFNDKVNLGFNTGLQHDDLNDHKEKKMKQMVSSVNLGLNLTDNLNININFSNFQSYTNIKNRFEEINSTDPYSNLDTLDFTQISRNMGFSASYQLSSDKKTRQQISLNGSWQEASSEQGDVPVNSGNTFYNLSASYNYTLQPTGLSVNTTFNMNQNKGQGMSSMIFGPNLAVNKSFLDRKLRSSLSVSYNRNYTENDLTNEVYNVRLSNSFKWKEQHSLQLSAIYMNRQSPGSVIGGFSQFTIRMNYSYRFK